MKGNAVTVAAEEKPKPDIERLAAEWAYARIRDYEDAVRASGRCASSLAWGGSSKSEAFLAYKLRVRVEATVAVPFYTGLAYWTGELEKPNPGPSEPVVYVASFDFRKLGQCKVAINFKSRTGDRNPSPAIVRVDR